MTGEKQSEVSIVQPPYLGVNSTDPISQMDPNYARYAINWFGQYGKVSSRKGLAIFGSNVPSNARSVFQLSLPDGTNKLIAIGGNGRPYDCSAGGAAPVDLSFAGAFISQITVHSANFRGRIFFKGEDNTRDVLVWDGVAASVAFANFTGPLTGGVADDKDLWGPAVYKSRLYFMGHDLSIWYGKGDVNGITGALDQFDMQSIFKLGGQLTFIGSTSKQGFLNAQLFVAISNKGEILLYQGSYPGSADWELVGSYITAPPNDTNACFYWGANLVIITTQGVVLLSEIINQGTNLTYLSAKINSLFPALIKPKGCFFPNQSMIVIIGLTVGGVTPVFAMDTISGGWWQWRYDNTIYDLCLFGSNLMFGSDFGMVCYAYFNDADESLAIPGTYVPMSLDLRYAYNYLDNPSVVKHFLEARPVVTQKTTLDLTLDVATDYQEKTPTSKVTYNPGTAAGDKVFVPRMGLNGIGKAASIVIKESTSVLPLTINSTEILWRAGSNEDSGIGVGNGFDLPAPT